MLKKLGKFHTGPTSFSPLRHPSPPGCSQVSDFQDMIEIKKFQNN